MRISSELIQRCSSKHLLPVLNNEEHMERITHLYLQEQHIRTIENLHSCRNLVALYLYDNKIEKIENLDHLICLNCLYLHKNAISQIENLNMLSQLTVLSLGHNSISKLDGLDALCELRELYIQYQRLPEGQSLEFDPDTISWLSETLRIVNVSGNKLQSFSPLKPLEYLENFTAEENDVCDLQDLVDVLSNWKYVQALRLTGNPVCSVRKYRDNAVVTCLELEELDGKVISQPYRNFLLNWKQCQTLQDRKKESYAVLKPFLETRQFVAGQVEMLEGKIANVPTTTKYVHEWIKDQLLSTWESLRSSCQTACDKAATAIQVVSRHKKIEETTCVAKCADCHSQYYICPPGTAHVPCRDCTPIDVDSGYWLYVNSPTDASRGNKDAMHAEGKALFRQLGTLQTSNEQLNSSKSSSTSLTETRKAVDAVGKTRIKSATVRMHPYSCPYFLRSKGIVKE